MSSGATIESLRKNVLRAVLLHGGVEAGVMARELMREVLPVPENRRPDEIIEDFQRKEIQPAAVVDEWGSFEGLVRTEEIVGEIQDEFDDEEPAVRTLPNGSYAVDGRLPISVANEALGAGLANGDFGTIGGLVLGALGRPPEVGDEAP